MASIWSIFVAYGSHKTHRRGMWVLISTPLSLVGAIILLSTGNKKVGYGGIFLLATGGMYNMGVSHPK